MKTLTEIINGKGSKKQAKQIAKLVEVIAEARKDYGNTGEDIPAPVITGTTEGSVKFTNLSAADKLVLVNTQISQIRQEVNEVEFYLDGKVKPTTLQLVLEDIQAAAIATNPILVHLDSSTNSKYL